MAKCNNTTAKDSGLPAIRCAKCRTLLLFGGIRPGSELFIACRKCKFENHWTSTTEGLKAIHDGPGVVEDLGESANRRAKTPAPVCSRPHSDVPEQGGSKARRLIIDVDAALKVWEQKWERLERIAGEVTEAEAIIAERRKRLDEAGRPAVKPGLRFNVFTRDRFRCRYCGLSAADGVVLNADHVVPESRGGPTTLENLVTSCWDCNQGKKAKIINGLRELLAG